MSNEQRSCEPMNVRNPNWVRGVHSGVTSELDIEPFYGAVCPIMHRIPGGPPPEAIAYLWYTSFKGADFTHEEGREDSETKAQERVEASLLKLRDTITESFTKKLETTT